MLKHLFVLILIPFLLRAADIQWGWGAHRYINEHAVDYLPPEMQFFQDHKDFIREHAVDPDQSSNRPGYWHYIDIDYYPEFFSHTLPTDLNTLTTMYSWSTITNNGIVPWAITYEVDSLKSLMAAGQWDIAWQAVADLGHYVADSHQPLHLTQNYNGQMTGNSGIHSRYETTMTNAHLDDLPLPAGSARYLDSIIDTVFQYIGEVYPYVDLIMAADNAGRAQDASYGSTYYNILWSQLDSITTDALNRSILDLASIWYSAWVDAGSPYPPGVNVAEESQPAGFILEQNYPNPFNPTTTIAYSLSQAGPVQLIITDIMGRTVCRFDVGDQTIGEHTLMWDGHDQATKPVTTGIYFTRLTAEGISRVIKMTYLK